MQEATVRRKSIRNTKNAGKHACIFYLDLVFSGYSNAIFNNRNDGFNFSNAVPF